MGLWSRAPQQVEPERRSGWPLFTLEQVGSMFGAAFMGGRAANPSVGDNALQVVAFGAACDLVASLSSELPAHVYRGTGSARTQLSTPGWLEDPAGDGYGLADWVYRLVLSWLLRGNAFGDVLARGPGGFPTQVELLNPHAVGGSVVDGVVKWTVAGRPVADAGAFWHLRVNPAPGRVLGRSPVEYHAEQLGMSLTSTRFGLRWFEDGAHPSGILANSEVELNPEQSKTAKDRFLAAVRGNREPVVLGKGWSFEQVQLNPEESQFLQTQGYSAAECARILGPGLAEVLGYESGGSLTYTNVESRSAHLLVYSLNKWLRRVERVLTAMLPRPQYVRIDRDALLQSTTLERYKAHESALRNRWKVVNEVREDEDMPGVAWGDEPNVAGAEPAQPNNDEPTGAETPALNGRRP